MVDEPSKHVRLAKVKDSRIFKKWARSGVSDYPVMLPVRDLDSEDRCMACA